jgi:3,4-dihydroxy 2-butanone 4-phosphate synthase/GTP cyclohydrolase II
MTTTFASISDVADELRQGKCIVTVDDERRENEGDLICAAECVTPETTNFMLKYARGVLCLALTAEHCERLHLTPQVAENTSPHRTAFQVFIDAAPKFGVKTGESAFDRATTIRRAVDPSCRPSDLVRPGHVAPLRAKNGGVLVRAGHTEAAVDLVRLAGMQPAAVICPILADNGEMARLPELEVFAKQFDLKLCTIADLIEHRQQHESLIERAETIDLPTEFGNFTLIEYRTFVDPQPQLALCKGGVGELDDKGQPILHPEPVLVRVHSECLTGDVFKSLRCDCGEQLAHAMHLVAEEGKGAVVYLRQEGRGIGLDAKIRAYKLQDGGLDTVEANEALGFPADKRDYGIGAQILLDLGLRKLRILTNNPKKVERLDVYGLDVVEQVPIQITPNELNRRYLDAKKRKLGHLLDNL